MPRLCQTGFWHRRARTPTRRFTALCVVVSWLALLGMSPGMAPRVAAEGTLADREGQASERFDRGVALYAEGNMDAALVELERAYELVPNYKILFNLAQIQAERHEYVAAVGLYERYLADGGDDVPAARRSESIEQIKVLRDSVVPLWVETDVEGAKLFVDDEQVADLPLSEPVSVDAGVRHLRVEKPGYAPAFRKLKVAGGDQPRLSIPLGQLAVASEPAPERERTAAARGRVNYRPVWIAASSTLALASATLTFGLLARRGSRNLDLELDRFPARPDVIRHDRAVVKADAALADGFGVASLLALGVTLYFLIAPPKQRVGGSKDLTRGTADVFVHDGHLGLRGVF